MSPNQCLEVVRSLVGRRSSIDRAEMAQILRRLQAAGLSLVNDCVLPERATPSGWAEMCKGTLVISVLADGTTPHGQVRYDQPGTLHPLHRAAIMFAPGEMSSDPTRAHLRRHARRVLFVR